MTIQKTRLRRNFIILCSVAMAVTALGIFVHGRVFPLQPADVSKLSSTKPRQQVQGTDSPLSVESSISSEVTAHLKQAIDRENQQAAQTEVSIQRRVAQTKRQLKSVQDIRQQQGNQIGPLNNEVKQQAFAGKIQALKAQLAEMQ